MAANIHDNDITNSGSGWTHLSKYPPKIELCGRIFQDLTKINTTLGTFSKYNIRGINLNISFPFWRIFQFTKWWTIRIYCSKCYKKNEKITHFPKDIQKSVPIWKNFPEYCTDWIHVDTFYLMLQNEDKFWKYHKKVDIEQGTCFPK